MANRELGPSKFGTDWRKCCLRQTKKDNDLTPRSQQTQENDGYTMHVVNILLFYINNEMPILLDPARLDDSGGIGEI